MHLTTKKVVFRPSRSGAPAASALSTLRRGDSETMVTWFCTVSACVPHTFITLCLSCMFSTSDHQVPEGGRGEGLEGGPTAPTQPTPAAASAYFFHRASFRSGPCVCVCVCSVCVRGRAVKSEPESCVTQSLLYVIMCTEFSVYSST